MNLKRSRPSLIFASLSVIGLSLFLGNAVLADPGAERIAVNTNGCYYVGKAGSERCCTHHAPSESVCSDKKITDCCLTSFAEAGSCQPKAGLWSDAEMKIASQDFTHYTCANYKPDPKFRMPMNFFPHGKNRQPAAARKRRTYYEILDQAPRFEFLDPPSASR